MLPVDKNVPMPDQNKTGQSIYPWAELEIGDSFYVPGKRTSLEIAGSVSQAKRKYGHKYSCRKVDGGLRVWRVA